MVPDQLSGCTALPFCGHYVYRAKAVQMENKFCIRVKHHFSAGLKDLSFGQSNLLSKSSYFFTMCTEIGTETSIQCNRYKVLQKHIAPIALDGPPS